MYTARVNSSDLIIQIQSGKISETARYQFSGSRIGQENRKVSFQMVIDDVYAIGKGRLVGRPRY